MSANNPKRTFMVLDQMSAKDPKGHNCPLDFQDRTGALRSLQVLLLPWPSVPRLHPPFGSDLLRFDFPRRVVRDVHGGVAAFTGERWHRITCERLFARNTRILPSTSGDEMSTATHIRLRFVDIARIER